MVNGLSDIDHVTVLLVGFMAAGKTALGRALAERTGWTLMDVDRDIEAAYGCSVAQLFEDFGEPWFRSEEDRRTLEALDLTGTIVVPGGGWAALPGRMERLPAHVRTVWLRVTAESAVLRASKEGDTRPLLGAGPTALDAARRLLAEREPYYRLADLHLDTEGRLPLELAGEILEFLRRREGSARLKRQ